jgi:hypothetical protein
VNLSVWRHDTCVGTVRLLPSEVANLMAGLSEGLAQLAHQPEASPASFDDAERLREMERRLVLVESRVATRPWRSAVTAAADRAKGAVRAVRSAARGEAAH